MPRAKRNQPSTSRSRPFRKILAANRGEIAIRIFRAATELGASTVAIYSDEDKLSLHRYKAEESYVVGKGAGPVGAYLAIDEILDLAKSVGVDAIHPGYGFLSERPEFAAACERAGLTFIGPPSEILRRAADKTEGKKIAAAVGVPIIPGGDTAVANVDEALAEAQRLGYPIMLKAAHGGGGRGMRQCKDADELRAAFPVASREAELAFGSGAVFLEKMIVSPRHVEVQVLADHHGNVVHLFERDCSIQRRFQKIVETAPAAGLSPKLREEICDMAVSMARRLEYRNAGTFEFLIDADDQPYFIEINPRVQVEHTVTEVVTGVDVVQSQIWIAAGHALESPEVGIPSQASVSTRGYAVQCRITTENPEHDFTPEYGKIAAYRSAVGFGIRLDAGSAFSGAVVTPYYDSLLVKVTAWGNTLPAACRRMSRTLAEFRVRGLSTNIPFLSNIVNRPEFQKGQCRTDFIGLHPELFRFPVLRDRATRLIRFLGDLRVHGNPIVPPGLQPPHDVRPEVPAHVASEAPSPGSKQVFEERGAEGLVKWMQEEDRLLVTDTTFRDAHQSLLATRMRTLDLLKIAPAYAHLLPDLFSMEVWGGATFDTAMRFLQEDPWKRLARIREAIPNILLQMLIRGDNIVGYSRYPSYVVEAFVREARQAGVDLFRIFDSLNCISGMTKTIDVVRRAGGIAEASICYTGDVLDPRRDRYDLKYYIDLARELERRGAHILAIKDMAGLCKPYAASVLVSTLKQEVGIPVHFHTHDTSGIQAASIVKACEAGVDAVDLAIASMSGCTSQVNLNSIVAILRGQDRDPGLDLDALNGISDYFEEVRRLYYPFESDLRSGTAEVYEHEMPGGQYSNLRQQADSLGVGARWVDIKRAYVQANELLGDIVKVTPSSKIVGDFALFMVSNNLTPEEILAGDRHLSFPESVVGFFEGDIGKPPFGFPRRLREIVLKGSGLEAEADGDGDGDSDGEKVADVKLEDVESELADKLGRKPTERELLSYLMYPKVFLDYEEAVAKHADVSTVPTATFLFGPSLDEEIAVQIEKGKSVILKLVSVGEPGPDGIRRLVFEVNGVPREIDIEDRNVTKKVVSRRKADPGDLHQLVATMRGVVAEVHAAPGKPVEEGETVFVIEAMKMQVSITAPFSRVVKEVFVEKGSDIEAGDLLLTFE